MQGTGTGQRASKALFSFQSDLPGTFFLASFSIMPRMSSSTYCVY